MYEYLFDIYQKWLIDNNQIALSKFLKLPKKTIAVLIIFFVLLIMSLCLLLLCNELGNTAIFSALLIEILSIIILNSHQKDFIKDRSGTRLKNHIIYCNNLKKYLILHFKEFNQSESYFIVLKNDLNHKISELQDMCDKIFTAIKGIFNVLLVPISASLVAGISNQSIPISQIVIITINVTLFTLTAYLIIWSIASMISLIIKSEIKKYKQFASDICCIVDMKSESICKVRLAKCHRYINKLK